MLSDHLRFTCIFIIEHHHHRRYVDRRKACLRPSRNALSHLRWPDCTARTWTGMSSLPTSFRRGSNVVQPPCYSTSHQPFRANIRSSTCTFLRRFEIETLRGRDIVENEHGMQLAFCSRHVMAICCINICVELVMHKRTPLFESALRKRVISLYESRSVKDATTFRHRWKVDFLMRILILGNQ